MRMAAKTDGRVFIVETVEHLAQAIAQARVAGYLGRGGEGRAQQQDAEIGVAAGGGERGFDGAQDARADLLAGGRDQGRGGDGARLELGHLHAVAAGVDVNVAGLEGLELGAAGGEEQIARSALALRRDMVLDAALMCAADARRRRGGNPRRSFRAMSTSETLCSPRQDGLLFTSSTSRRPSGVRMRSTPA